MKMVFLLIVVIAGSDEDSDPRWLFDSLFTCNRYASWIERQATSADRMNPERQHLVTAYCVPRMVPIDTPVIWKTALALTEGEARGKRVVQNL